MKPAQERPAKQPPLTHHGRKRGKQRAGLDGKALRRTAATALSDGLAAAETRGRLRRYMEGLSIGYRHAVHRLHGNHIFCFSSDHVLITVLELPHGHRKAAASALQKRGGAA